VSHSNALGIQARRSFNVPGNSEHLEQVLRIPQHFGAAAHELCSLHVGLGSREASGYNINMNLLIWFRNSFDMVMFHVGNDGDEEKFMVHRGLFALKQELPQFSRALTHYSRTCLLLLARLKGCV
jgi:hypothetical protein